MATMIEKKAESARKELEKLLARKERQEKTLVKKTAIAEKHDCLWTKEQWFSGKREEANPDQYSAWFDFSCAADDLKETIQSIEKAQKRLDNLTGKAEEQMQTRTAEENEVNRIRKIEADFLTAEQKEQQYEKWLKQFKAECLKDGIVIDEACSSYFTGLTKNGKKFFLDRNNGFTDRSWHCYSLFIGGQNIFTSGEFLTAYRYLMKH